MHQLIVDFETINIAMALDWTTVTLDLQRAVNNLALYVLESMKPPSWNQTICPYIDVTQPPPGYTGPPEKSEPDDGPPTKSPDKGLDKKKKKNAVN